MIKIPITGLESVIGPDAPGRHLLCSDPDAGVLLSFDWKLMIPQRQVFDARPRPELLVVRASRKGFWFYPQRVVAGLMLGMRVEDFLNDQPFALYKTLNSTRGAKVMNGLRFDVRRANIKLPGNSAPAFEVVPDPVEPPEPVAESAPEPEALDLTLLPEEPTPPLDLGDIFNGGAK